MDELLDRARKAYAEYRWDDAYRCFTEARRKEELGPEDLAALSDAAWWCGDTDESLALSEEVHDRHLRGQRVPEAGQLAIEIGFLWFLRGEPTVGSGWISRAARLLEDCPECSAHGYLAYVETAEAMANGEFGRAVELTRRIHELGDRHDDPTLRAIGLVLEGVAMVRDGRYDDGLAVIDEAMLPVRAGAVRPVWAGNLYCQVMGLFVELADIARARAWTEATERWCDQHSNAAMFSGICRVHRAQLLHLEGAWEEAEARASEACEDLIDMNVSVVAEGHYVIGDLRRARGDHDGAEAAYARAHELGREPQPGLARLRLAQGRTEVARTALHGALAAATEDLARAPLLVALVEVGAATGDAEEAGAAARELTHIAETFRTPGLLAAARQAAGTARLTASEPERAVPLLRDACRRWHEIDARLDGAHVRELLAAALGVLGDDETAAREQALGAEVLDELGAPHGTLHVPPPTDRSGDGELPGGLTRREVEVLGAVADGRTNAGIAAALGISERTVERHVSNIFVKLDVASRTEAARVAFDHGLVPSARSRPG
ncbi:MAG: LuxR C-terminal-related transcriptional regulator [Acidimicrobiia bacterium]|nr:LuxR C-terminal-related transcriptional regulator [Acidimicrobiia bacterium]